MGRPSRTPYVVVVLALIVFATAFIAVRESLGTGAVITLAIVNLALAAPVVAARPKA